MCIYLFDIAVQDIGSNVNPFVTNGDSLSCNTIDLLQTDIDQLPDHVKDLVNDFVLPHDENGMANMVSISTMHIHVQYLFYEYYSCGCL